MTSADTARFTQGEQVTIPAAMRPVLAQALRDAIDYHDAGQCGDPGHLFMVEQYERALDELGPRPALAAVEAPPG